MPNRKTRKASRRTASAAPAHTPRRVGRLASLLAINAAVFLCLLALLEGGARLAFSRDMRTLFDDPAVHVRGRPFVTRHPDRGFALTPGTRHGPYSVDARGFRVADASQSPAATKPAAEAKTATRQILTLGESSTFGWGVAYEETWPARLQAWLQQHGDSLQVVNAGVPSYSSSQVRLYLDELLQQSSPDIVLVQVMWNDALYAWMDNWYPELLTRQQPAAWRRFLLRHSAVYRAVVLRDQDPTAVRSEANPDAVAQYHRNVREIAALCRRRGVALAFVEPPVCSELLDSGLKIVRKTIPKASFLSGLELFVAALRQEAAAAGVPVIRHRLVLGESAPAAYFLDPAHPNAAGYAMEAEDIASALRDESLLLPGDPG